MLCTEVEFDFLGFRHLDEQGGKNVFGVAVSDDGDHVFIDLVTAGLHVLTDSVIHPKC